MKRTLLQRGAIIAACAAAFVLGGCGDTEFDSRTDTVYSLETPQVTAKAYPGVNIVSWKPVPGAQSYNVTVYEEGMATTARTKNCDKETTFYTDLDLENGKNYTYCVEAVSNSDPATITYKAVYATNSKGEASARAIVPPADTEALALPAYENGYDGKTTKTVSDNDKEWIVSKDNINAFFDNDTGTIIVEFPMKAYLTYDVKYYLNRGVISEDALESIETKKTDSSYINNVMGKASFGIDPNGGDSYEIVVVAKTRGKNFKSSKEIVSENKVTIKKLNVTDESKPLVGWVLNDDKFATGADKTVRVSFTPATQSDNSNKVPTDWYSVYRRVKGDSTNTIVDGTVSVDEVGNYYIEDTVDVTKTYVYTVVISHKDSDGEVRYGTTKTSDEFSRVDNALYSAPEITQVAYVSTSNKFIEGASKLVRISFSPAKVRKNGEVLPIGWHKVYRKAEDENVWTELAATIKINDQSTSPSNIVSTITYYAEDDTVTDVTKAYTYKIVVMDGNEIKCTESSTMPLNRKSEYSIPSITVTVDYTSSTSSKTVWNVVDSYNAQLSAKYLIVEGTRDLINAPVLVDEILAKGTTVNLAQVKDVNDIVTSSSYTVTAENYTFTGNLAYIYLAVQAKLDGYNTTNVISLARSISK